MHDVPETIDFLLSDELVPVFCTHIRGSSKQSFIAQNGLTFYSFNGTLINLKYGSTFYNGSDIS